MSVALPELPRAARFAPRLIRAGGDLKSSLGGPTQRISRLGSRYAVDVALPTMDLACGQAWVAAQLQAEAIGATVRLALPQRRDLPTGVTATGASGSTLVDVTGAGGAAIVAGMLFSFESGGVSYLHMVTGVDGAELSVAPRLRAALAGALEFEAPQVEGFLEETSWSVELLRFVGQTFTITEAR